MPRHLAAAAVFVLVVSLAPATRAQVMDPFLSTVEGPWTPVTVVITPFARGDTFESRGATLTVRLVDFDGWPVVGLPRQDIWIDDPGDGALSMCLGGSWADHDTDPNGVTTFGGRYAGGGASETLLVYVAGVAIVGAPLPVSVISPDYDADRRVTLADVGIFASDFASGTHPARSDFVTDGTLDLSDVGRFATFVGEECRP